MQIENVTICKLSENYEAISYFEVDSCFVDFGIC